MEFRFRPDFSRKAIMEKTIGTGMNIYLERAQCLQQHLHETHGKGGALEGSDPGVRLNARFGRFIKGYLRFLPWGDRYYYLQAQGYWIAANWMLFDLTGEKRYSQIATDGSYRILERQTDGGYWRYPFPEWGGRIATVEGCYAALGMLHTFRKNGDERLSAAASRWYAFLKKEIGFREEGDMLSVQYFANMDELATRKFSAIQLGRCPNNSTLLLMMIAEAYDATKDSTYLEHRDGLVNFLKFAQRADGKFPYLVQYKEHPGKEYYLCYQYNSFQFLDLARYYEITRDERMRPILEGLARFMRGGAAADGSSKFDSFHDTPFIPYYTAVLGAALIRATDLGFGDFSDLYSRVYARLLDVQRKDGSFTFSHKDYGFLSDGRSYPRPQSMILKHLLVRAEFERRKSSQQVGVAETTM